MQNRMVAFTRECQLATLPNLTLRIVETRKVKNAEYATQLEKIRDAYADAVFKFTDPSKQISTDIDPNAYQLDNLPYFMKYLPDCTLFRCIPFLPPFAPDFRFVPNGTLGPDGHLLWDCSELVLASEKDAKDIPGAGSDADDDEYDKPTDFSEIKCGIINPRSNSGGASKLGKDFTMKSFVEETTHIAKADKRSATEDEVLEIKEKISKLEKQLHELDPKAKFDELLVASGDKLDETVRQIERNVHKKQMSKVVVGEVRKKTQQILSDFLQSLEVARNTQLGSSNAKVIYNSFAAAMPEEVEGAVNEYLIDSTAIDSQYPKALDIIHESRAKILNLLLRNKTSESLNVLYIWSVALNYIDNKKYTYMLDSIKFVVLFKNLITNNMEILKGLMDNPETSIVVENWEDWEVFFDSVLSLKEDNAQKRHLEHALGLKQ